MSKARCQQCLLISFTDYGSIPKYSISYRNNTWNHTFALKHFRQAHPNSSLNYLHGINLHRSLSPSLHQTWGIYGYGMFPCSKLLTGPIFLSAMNYLGFFSISILCVCRLYDWAPYMSEDMQWFVKGLYALMRDLMASMQTEGSDASTAIAERYRAANPLLTCFTKFWVSLIIILSIIMNYIGF